VAAGQALAQVLASLFTPFVVLAVCIAAWSLRWAVLRRSTLRRSTLTSRQSREAAAMSAVAAAEAATSFDTGLKDDPTHLTEGGDQLGDETSDIPQADLAASVGCERSRSTKLRSSLSRHTTSAAKAMGLQLFKTLSKIDSLISLPAQLGIVFMVRGARNKLKRIGRALLRECTFPA
jgi:hypothetical protein